MKKLSVLCGFVGLVAAAPLWGSEGGAQRLLEEQWQQGAERRALFQESWRRAEGVRGESDDNVPGRKSVAMATVLSAVVPGAGEFYAGSYLKGAFFLAVEAASWPLHFHFQNRGEELTAEFERFADRYWHEDVYWQWLGEESGIGLEDFNGDYDAWIDALGEYERGRFSHFLPEERNQQYYENIGKYDQFNIGWEDTDAGEVADSELRFQYVRIRKDANDNFKRATNFATILMFNHVLSALDAAFTTQAFNRQVEARVQVQPLRYGREWLPAFALAVTW